MAARPCATESESRAGMLRHTPSPKVLLPKVFGSQSVRFPKCSVPTAFGLQSRFESVMRIQAADSHSTDTCPTRDSHSASIPVPRNHGLPQRDPAIIRRHDRMRQNAESKPLQSLLRQPKQTDVLKHASGQTNQINTRRATCCGTDVGNQVRHGMMKSCGDDLLLVAA